jgi:hypothetical protein
LSAYKIYWAEFIPTTGRVVTKRDQKALGARLTHMNMETYRKPFSSKQEAIEFLANFSGKLSKRYKVMLFSDKQMSMAKQENGYRIPYTDKQMKEVYYVG